MSAFSPGDWVFSLFIKKVILSHGSKFKCHKKDREYKMPFPFDSPPSSQVSSEMISVNRSCILPEIFSAHPGFFLDKIKSKQIYLECMKKPFLWVSQGWGLGSLSLLVRRDSSNRSLRGLGEGATSSGFIGRSFSTKGTVMEGGCGLSGVRCFLFRTELVQLPRWVFLVT